MSRTLTIAQAPTIALKHDHDPFDTAAGMRLQELKLRVERADYTVDPGLVAAAMLRHAVSQRRCWKPRAVCATPSDSSTTSGGPARTSPIQVSDAADAAASWSPAATQTSNS